MNLTATADMTESNPLFSPDSKTMAIGLKAVKAPATDIAVIDLATKAVRNLTNEKTPDRSWTPVAWSHDGKWIIANRSNADRTIGEIFAIDTASGQAPDLGELALSQRQNGDGHLQRERRA